MRIFLVDNYDSFTYNLFQYLEEEGVEVCVKRNDQFSLNEIEAYDKIVLPNPRRMPWTPSHWRSIWREALQSAQSISRRTDAHTNHNRRLFVSWSPQYNQCGSLPLLGNKPRAVSFMFGNHSFE